MGRFGIGENEFSFFHLMFQTNYLGRFKMRRFPKLIEWHIDVFYNYLDPISSGSRYDFRKRLQYQRTLHPKPNTSKWDFKFVIPALVILFTQFYCNFFVVYQAYGHFEWPTKVNDSIILNHQVFPRPAWPQSDMAHSISSASSVAIYASFWHNPFNIERYVCLRRGTRAARRLA